MYNSLRSHMTMGTAALFGAAAIAMHPVTETSTATFASLTAAPVSQTLEVALTASIVELLPGVEVIGPSPEGCGKSCGPLVSYKGEPGFACGPSPTCYVSQLYIRPIVDKFTQGAITPALNWLLPGFENAGMGALFIVPLALALSPILVPIRIVQSIIKPVKPGASARTANAAAAQAATGSPAGPKAAAVARPSRSAVSAARGSRNLAVAHAAPKAAAAIAGTAKAKKVTPLKDKLRATLAGKRG